MWTEYAGVKKEREKEKKKKKKWKEGRENKGAKRREGKEEKAREQKGREKGRGDNKPDHQQRVQRRALPEAWTSCLAASYFVFVDDQAEFPQKAVGQGGATVRGQQLLDGLLRSLPHTPAPRQQHCQESTVVHPYGGGGGGRGG